MLSEIVTAIVTEITEGVVAEVTSRLTDLVQAEQSPRWATTEELAEHSRWGLSTIQKLSGANAIPGKTVHHGKVTFHVPTFDQWLLTEYGTR